MNEIIIGTLIGAVLTGGPLLFMWAQSDKNYQILIEKIISNKQETEKILNKILGKLE